MIYHETDYGTIHCGDSLDVMKGMADESVDCCITSPPYWGLRDYGCNGQLGLEKSPEEYVANMVQLFREVRRVLKADGVLWLNLGDSYAGSGVHQEHHANAGISQSAKRGCTNGVPVPPGLKPKDLVGIPWRVAFALQADGWWLRQDIIWHKPNPMPESVRDRCTKSHEYIFMLTKSARYYFDSEAIKEPAADSSKARLDQNVSEQKGSERVPFKTNGSMKAVGGDYRNKRSVWTVTTKPYKEAHFATYPPDLILPCVKASPEYLCSECGTPYKRVITVIGKREGEVYVGQATKDYSSGKAQNPSDTKRRVLESMSRITKSSWQQGCSCCNAETKPAVILDPFFGSGTTGLVAIQNGRKYIGIELNPDYCEIAAKRIERELDQATIDL
jgi:DNA modification methylase